MSTNQKNGTYLMKSDNGTFYWHTVKNAEIIDKSAEGNNYSTKQKMIQGLKAAVTGKHFYIKSNFGKSETMYFEVFDWTNSTHGVKTLSVKIKIVP